MTPFELSKSLLDENPQNVSRWDSISGSKADWRKCFFLIKDVQHKSVLSSTNLSGHQTYSLPEHLDDFISCLDCESDGNVCKTQSWENAFRSYLSESIDSKVSKDTISVVDKLPKNVVI